MPDSFLKLGRHGCYPPAPSRSRGRRRILCDFKLQRECGCLVLESHIMCAEECSLINEIRPRRPARHVKPSGRLSAFLRSVVRFGGNCRLRRIGKPGSSLDAMDRALPRWNVLRYPKIVCRWITCSSPKVFSCRSLNDDGRRGPMIRSPLPRRRHDCKEKTIFPPGPRVT